MTSAPSAAVARSLSRAVAWAAGCDLSHHSGTTNQSEFDLRPNGDGGCHSAMHGEPVGPRARTRRARWTMEGVASMMWGAPVTDARPGAPRSREIVNLKLGR